MAMGWNLKADINNKTMEEVLIEVFGCGSPDKIVKIHAGIQKKLIRTEFYLAGNVMEMMLIEIFGCSTQDSSAIKLETGKTEKRINRWSYPDSYADDKDTIPMSVNA